MRPYVRQSHEYPLVFPKCCAYIWQRAALCVATPEQARSARYARGTPRSCRRPPASASVAALAPPSPHAPSLCIPRTSSTILGSSSTRPRDLEQAAWAVRDPRGPPFRRSLPPPRARRRLRGRARARPRGHHARKQHASLTRGAERGMRADGLAPLGLPEGRRAPCRARPASPCRGFHLERCLTTIGASRKRGPPAYRAGSNAFSAADARFWARGSQISRRFSSHAGLSTV